MDGASGPAGGTWAAGAGGTWGTKQSAWSFARSGVSPGRWLEEAVAGVGAPSSELPGTSIKSSIDRSWGGRPVLKSRDDLIIISPSPEEGARSTPTTGPSADEGESPSPRPPTPGLPLSEKERITFNCTLQYHLSPEELLDLTNEIYEKKSSILSKLRLLTGPESGQILFGSLDSAGIAIRNPKGEEYSKKSLNMILQSLQQRGIESTYFAKFQNKRMHSIPNEDFYNLRI